MYYCVLLCNLTLQMDGIRFGLFAAMVVIVGGLYVWKDRTSVTTTRPTLESFPPRPCDGLCTPEANTPFCLNTPPVETLPV